MVVATGKLQHWLLEPDDEPIPETFWKEGNFSPSIADDGDSAAAPGERERWLRVTVLADDCTRLWPHPSSFLEQEPMPIGAAVADLMTEPAERLGWLLIRPDVTVTCLNAEGERVPMDRGIFRTSDFTIDNTANSINADGRRWVSVMVGLAAVEPTESAVSPEVPPPGRAPVGRPKTPTHEYLARAYPNGTTKTTTELMAELKSANIGTSVSTIERALGRRSDSDRSSKPRPNK
jgi:hypothetical protein